MKIASVVACLALQTLLCCAAMQAADDAAQLDAVRKSVELERAGKLPDAIAALGKDDSAATGSYFRNVRLGWLNYESATYPEAERYYQIASGLAPTSIEALQGLTLSLLAENKYADADAAARKVLQLDAGNFSANLRLAIALRQQSKVSGAVEILRQLLVGYPSNYYVAEEFKELQKADAAAANTIPAAEFFDASAKTAWQKSLDAELKGNYADAIKALTYAFKRDPAVICSAAPRLALLRERRLSRRRELLRSSAQSRAPVDRGQIGLSRAAGRLERVFAGGNDRRPGRPRR